MGSVKLLNDTQRLFVFIILTLRSSQALPFTDAPISPDQPFLFMWNAPSELCESRFGIPLDLSYFHYVSSTLKTATDQSISIFYTDRFGVFPYVEEDTGEMYDEGLPHLVDLEEHHEQAEDDILNYIPEDGPGLAVLDFEEWRPQWVRNWGSKDIYRQISIETVAEKNPTMPPEKVEARAKFLFERGAKKYFLKSLRIGKRLRPIRLWGYYLYPDCYNYDYNQDMEGFTGECPAIEQERNDELTWLWEESTALFPSIYLELVLKDSQQARLYVRHRIREAMRVSSHPDGRHSTPIYAYIRPVYKDSVDDYMSEFDLVNTIGEAAALGAAGVVSWGDMDVSDDDDSCYDARRHLEQIMNPYILNVTTAAQLCSRALCQSRGRCVRKNWDEDVYLHLDPRRYTIQRQRHGGPLTVSGELSYDDINMFDRSFDCMCYSPEPCRSELQINFLLGAVATTKNSGAERPRPFLLVVLLLCATYAIMGRN